MLTLDEHREMEVLLTYHEIIIKRLTALLSRCDDYPIAKYLLPDLIAGGTNSLRHFLRANHERQFGTTGPYGPYIEDPYLDAVFAAREGPGGWGEGLER